MSWLASSPFAAVMIHFRTAPEPGNEALLRALQHTARRASGNAAHALSHTGQAGSATSANGAAAMVKTSLCIFDETGWRAWFARQRAVIDDDNGRLRRMVWEESGAPVYQPLRPALPDAALTALREGFPNDAR